MERFIRAFWYLSVLIVFFGLMYSFASLPTEVLYSEEFSTIPKDTYFYGALVIIAITNFTLYALARQMGQQKRSTPLSVALQSWLFGLNFSLNLFFFVALMFVMMYNSNEKWDFELLGYGIYLSIGTIVLTIISFPILLKTSKESNQS